MEQKELDYLASLGPVMPGHVKPAHVGWYPRAYGHPHNPESWLISRDYWDGTTWWYGDATGAHKLRAGPGGQNKPWRGLSDCGAGAVLHVERDTADNRLEIPVVEFGEIFSMPHLLFYRWGPRITFGISVALFVAMLVLGLV